MDPDITLKILILEDNVDDASLMEHVLAKDKLKFECVRVDTRTEFVEALDSFKPEVILSDHGLPSFNSRDALKIAQQVSPTPLFILVTGTVSDEYAISCLQLGADDYILKSNLSRLPVAIRGALRKKKLEQLRKDNRQMLRRRNKDLAKANKELDAFVYSISHYLRGPLASLMGLMDVVRDEPSKPSTQVIGMMDRSLHKLDDSLTKILNYFQNARSIIKIDPIDWKQIIDDTFDSLQYLDREKKVTRQVTIDVPGAFYSDSFRIQMILSNLLSNALIFLSSKREGIIRVDARILDGRVVLSVTDNGIGMKENVTANIGRMFYRGSELSRGSGLGLYITKEIVNRLGGEFYISSEHNIGTVVKIVLPDSRD